MTHLQDSDLIFYQPQHSEPQKSLSENVYPRKPAPCVCRDNCKKFAIKMTVYCPRHGEENVGDFNASSRQPDAKFYTTVTPKQLRPPPANCANGFIITFENQEEIFCRPHDFNLFLKSREDKVYEIIQTIEHLRNNNTFIFGNTTHETRTTYFEMVQTPLDFSNGPSCVPLTSGSNLKLLVKNWTDTNGQMVFMVMELPTESFGSFEKPLNNFSRLLERHTIGPPVFASTPSMDVYFLGIRNPWFYSRAVPFNTQQMEHERLSQIRENHMTTDVLRKFEDVLLSLPHTPNPYNITMSILALNNQLPICVTVGTFVHNLLNQLPWFNIPGLTYTIPSTLYPRIPLERLATSTDPQHQLTLLNIPESDYTIPSTHCPRITHESPDTSMDHQQMQTTIQSADLPNEAVSVFRPIPPITLPNQDDPELSSVLDDLYEAGLLDYCLNSTDSEPFY